MYMGGKAVSFGGDQDDPYWDVPERPVDIDEPIYELLSREMIHDGWGKGEPLEVFIQNIRDAAADAPEGLPVFAKYDQESDYEGGYYYFLQIGYERPPTKEERSQRREINRLVDERNARRAEAAAERERKEFERLKAKFTKTA
jgi:hypothetical protein